MTFRHAAKSCPVCKYPFEAATSGDPDKMDQVIVPEPGDASICIGCRSFLIFTDDQMNCRLATADDMADMPVELRSQMVSLREVLRRMDAATKAPPQPRNTDVSACTADSDPVELQPAHRA